MIMMLAVVVVLAYCGHDYELKPCDLNPYLFVNFFCPFFAIDNFFED